MLTPVDQPSAGRLGLVDGGLEVRHVGQTEAEVIDSAVDAGTVGSPRVLVERDQIVAAGGPEKDHVAAFPEALLEPEHARVEGERAIEVLDHEVDMDEPTRRHHHDSPSYRS